jgi:putative transposase
MKGATMKATLESLGILASYSRPRVSNDNPFSEALFRTCKYRPNWPTKGFADITAAQTWVKGFTDWYNNQHLHSAIRFVTPNTRHAGKEGDILKARAHVYAKARETKPERWSKQARNWQPIGPVWLNPEKDLEPAEIRAAA